MWFVFCVFFSFSQLQLKNLHDDLSGRLEESLSIITEKVPFNDTSRYSIICNFEPLSVVMNSLKKFLIYLAKNFIDSTEGCFLFGFFFF